MYVYCTYLYVPIRLVPPRFPVDPPPKSHKTINYLLVLVLKPLPPKGKVMLNSDDAIHIVPLLWAGLGGTSYLFRIQLRHPATAAPIHSHRQKKTKRSFVRHVGPIVACRRLRRQGSMYFPLFPPPPFPLSRGSEAASGRYVYSASNNPAPVPPNPFR